MTSPARTIVLIVPPTVAQHQRRGEQRQRDGGQADHRGPPVEQEQRPGSTTTSTQPTSSARVRLSSDRSMNVAGRKMVGVDLDALQRRAAAPSSAASTSRVTSQRVAPRLLLDDQQQAGAVVDDGVADRRRDADRRPRRRRRAASGAPLRKRRRRLRARSSGVVDRRPRAGRRAAGSACRRSRRRRRPTASRRGLDDRVERDAVRRAAGRDRPAPGTAGRAGPRSPRSPRRARPSAAGRIVHRASIVSSICDSVFDDTPIFSTRLVDDSGGRMHRRPRHRGQRAARRGEPLLHELPGARCRSVPSLEDQHDRRQPEHRLRAERLQARHAVERVLERHA